MSRPSTSDFEPRRIGRRIQGPLFGAACLLATLTGVVVLAILLGSVVVAALGRPPSPPWYAVGAQARELIDLVRSLTDRFQSGDPASAGFRAGLVGSLWLLGLVAAFAVPVGIG
jgi:phosphate transport system permease protein